MLRLLCNQGRVDFQHAGDACQLCVMHARETPQRIPFIDQVEGTFSFQGRLQPGVRRETGPLARGQFAFWQQWQWVN